MDKLLESLFVRLVRVGALTVRTSKGHRFAVGDGSGRPLEVAFRDRRAELRFLRNPALTLGEAYMDGDIEIVGADLYDFIELALRNYDAMEMAGWLRFLDKARFVTRRLRQNNFAARSRQNVAHHYDLDARLYSMFLDRDMQYSCAYFETPGDDLETAQLAKKRHIAAKLLVEPGHRVLDIGCGWGGLGLYLAEVCDAKVTGVTLSSEQLAIANRRALQADGGRDIASRLAFRLQDYRAIAEKFDRVVSVGMLEHVGAGYLQTYFAKVADLLDDDGVALIHTIGRPEGPGATNPWIAKYIFPGGYIPALSELTAAIEKAGLLICDIETLRIHYAQTLKHWRERFTRRREEARAIYDERFCRMWEFYLAASEASFRLGQNVVFQLQLAKKADAIPLTRDYIAERKSQLRAREFQPAAVRLAG